MRKRHSEWISSKELQQLVLTHTTALPRTAVRRLQEAVEDGELEVKYIGKATYYRAVASKTPLGTPQTPQSIFIPGTGYIRA